ncbi:hemoglobin F-I-like [Dermacentor variabilis]|uniref:hemoglobin F-I-like n=1 Tax=Dermacentor variabilis TaxID=34621 RepID=UPI003F5C6B23
MGKTQSKESADKSTGMTKWECQLVLDTWRTFCTDNQQAGILIFSAFLTQNPCLLPLFHRLRAMPLKMLPSDPTFRAHACSVAYQITAMVNSADDSVLLEALVRKNALAHTSKPGVYPQHFEILASVIMEVLQSKGEKTPLTPTAVTAWKKLFEVRLTVLAL